MAKTDTASPEKAIKVLSANKVKALLRAADKMQEDVNTLTSDFAQEIKDAKKQGIHKKAFGHLKTLNRMTPESLREYLHHFNHYMDVSGLNDRAASAPVLPMGEEDADEEEQPDGNPATEGATRRGRNVRPFPRPVGEASE